MNRGSCCSGDGRLPCFEEQGEDVEMKQSPMKATHPDQEHNQKYNNNMDSRDGINVAEEAKYLNTQHK